MREMKERPIIFSGEMVRAILTGNKTQTRRVVKVKSRGFPGDSIHDWAKSAYQDGGGNWVFWSNDEKGLDRFTKEVYPNGEGIKCPYGRPGDCLWVRETFYHTEGSYYSYRADDEMIEYFKKIGSKWQSPIHMPREASRITLEITEVRVERVAGISIDDCFAEGIQLNGRDTEEVRNLFRISCNKLNSKRGFYWSEADIPNNMRSGNGITICINPWVWVIEFKKL